MEGEPGDRPATSDLTTMSSSEQEPLSARSLKADSQLECPHITSVLPWLFSIRISGSWTCFSCLRTKPEGGQSHGLGGHQSVRRKCVS